MVEYASKKDLKITLSINAPDLKKDRIERLIQSNPFKIIISLDGHNDESYKKIRGEKADFKKALMNIDLLLKVKDLNLLVFHFFLVKKRY